MSEFLGRRRALAGLTQGICLLAICAGILENPALASEAREAIAGLDQEAQVAQPWFAEPLASALRGSLDEEGQVLPWRTTTILLNDLGSMAMQDAPAWLRRTTVNWEFDELMRSRFELTSSQVVRPPIGMLGFGLLQSHFAHSDHEQTRGSLGMAYRRLLDDDHWLFGINSFYDYGWQHRQDRMSIGGQLSSGVIEVTTNYYLPASAEGAGLTGSPVLSGYDVEANLQLPYLPWASAYAYGDGWRMIDANEDAMGSHSAGLRLSPLPFLDLTGEVVDDGGERPFYTFGFRVNIAFGETRLASDLPLIDDQPFHWRDMRSEARRPVRRENVIRLHEPEY